MYDLFNEAVSNSDYIASHDRMTSEQWIDKIWKEAVKA